MFVFAEEPRKIIQTLQVHVTLGSGGEWGNQKTDALS